MVSTGNKELHSETNLDGIGSSGQLSGHDFSDEFLINVMTSSVNVKFGHRRYVFGRFIKNRGKFWYGIELFANVLYLTNKAFTDVVDEHVTVGDLW